MGGNIVVGHVEARRLQEEVLKNDPEYGKKRKELRRIARLTDKGAWPDWISDDLYGSKAQQPGAWEIYVRRFCIVNQVTPSQKQSAYGILKQSRKRAEPLALKARELAKNAKAVQQLARCHARIAAIFTDSFVPRLDAILTSTQASPVAASSQERAGKVGGD